TPKVAQEIEKENDKNKGENKTVGPEETRYLQYKLTNDGTTETIEKIDDSAFNIFKSLTDIGYKRYPMHSFTIICALLSLGIAYAFTLFVFIVTIFELVMKKVIAPLDF
ncbi:hypothetical protein COK29_26890, partial [Bacillus cereus]